MKRRQHGEHSAAIRVRPGTALDAQGIVDIARGLPAWFSKNGIAQITADLESRGTLVADRDGRLAGFLVHSTEGTVGRIAWMGVREPEHRKGIGRALVGALAAELRRAGVAEMVVGTLGDSDGYEPYARTRAFYRALGFEDLRREFRDDPECPELLTLRLRR